MAPPPGNVAPAQEDPEELAKESGHAHCVLLVSLGVLVGAALVLCGFLVPGLSAQAQDSFRNIGFYCLGITGVAGAEYYVRTFGCWCVKSYRRRPGQGDSGDNLC